MAEDRDKDPSKSFRVIDKRSMGDEPAEGNRSSSSIVEQGQAAGGGPRVGGPSFVDLVGELQFGALVSLGMVQSPDGKRTPVNLGAAKDAIDLMTVLQEKTKGNLTDEESAVLTEGLYHLRMAYVQMANTPASPEAKGGVKL